MEELKTGEKGAEPAGAPEKPSDRARWLAAISYILFMCVFSLVKARKDPFVRFHASQGFLLFLAECSALVAAAILGMTVGRITIVGLVVVGLFELATGLAALALSVMGFVKALFGEYWNMPFLGEFREKIPGFDNREG